MIADFLMPYRDDLDVSLLLGINCASEIKPREIIPGNDNDPYAQRIALGWGAIGIVWPGDCKAENEEDCAGANRIIPVKFGAAQGNFVISPSRRTQRKSSIHYRKTRCLSKTSLKQTLKNDQFLLKIENLWRRWRMGYTKGGQSLWTAPAIQARTCQFT